MAILESNYCMFHQVGEANFMGKFRKPVVAQPVLQGNLLMLDFLRFAATFYPCFAKGKQEEGKKIFLKN